MGEDAQNQLALLGERPARSQRGAEPELVPAEGALGVPALVIQCLWEALAHLPAVSGAWPASPHVARVELDHGPTHAELLAAEPVVVLRIIARVRQSGVDGEQCRRLPHRGCEVGRVLRGSDPRDGAEDEVRVRVDDRRQLGPGASASVPALRLPATHAIVEADVPGLKTGRIDRRHRGRSDQTLACGASENRSLSLEKGPPFSAPLRSRCSA